MTTAKRKRKRRSDYDETVDRAPNGRKSRSRKPSQPTEDMRAVVINARIRHGVKPADAEQPEAGCEVGRLLLSGDITQALYDASVKLFNIHHTAMRAFQVPDSLVRSDGGGSSADDASQEYIHWATAATATWQAYKAAMADIGCEDVVNRVVIQGHECLPDDLPALRRGLSVLAIKFGIVAKSS